MFQETRRRHGDACFMALVRPVAMNATSILALERPGNFKISSSKLNKIRKARVQAANRTYSTAH